MLSELFPGLWRDITIPYFAVRSEVILVEMTEGMPS